MPYFRAKVQKHFITSKQNCNNFYVFNESADTLRHTKDIPKTYQRLTKDNSPIRMGVMVTLRTR